MKKKKKRVLTSIYLLARDMETREERKKDGVRQLPPEINAGILRRPSVQDLTKPTILLAARLSSSRACVYPDDENDMEPGPHIAKIINGHWTLRIRKKDKTFFWFSKTSR